MQPRRPSFLEALLLVVGLVLTVQYAWLMDDAFVYFRYADNLLFAQRGLVYNAGEFVEGYSSPLWMVLLTAVRGLGLDWWLAVRLLGGAVTGLPISLLVHGANAILLEPDDIAIDPMSLTLKLIGCSSSA